MEHIEQAATKRMGNGSRKTQEEEALRSRLDTLSEAMRRVTSVPKKAEMKKEIQTIKDRLAHIRGEKASVEQAGIWPKDFYTRICLASKNEDMDEGSFTEKGASPKIRGQYDASSTFQGTTKTRWVPIVMHHRNLIKHDLNVIVYHPSKPDKSFSSVQNNLEHVAYIHTLLAKAGKIAAIRAVKDPKSFLNMAKKGVPVAVVIPHPKHGFEIVISEAAETKAWRRN